jgi:hypothetical protein
MGALYTTSMLMQELDYHSGVVRSVQDDCPLLALMPEGKTVKNWDDKWAIKPFPTGDNPAVGEGVDKTTGFTSQVPIYVDGKCQIMRSAGWHVSKQRADGLARSAADVAGAKADQIAYDARNLLIGVEKVIGSNQEAAEATVDGKIVRYTRAMPPWLSPNAHAVQDVDASVRPTADQVYDGALEAFDEDKLRSMLLAAAIQRNGPVSLMGFCGLKLKQKMSFFPLKVEKTDAIEDKRQVNIENSREFSVMVDLFTFDGCTLKTVWMPRLFCDHTAAGMPTTKYTHTSGILADMTMWEIAYFNRMTHIDCSKLDTGAGPRGYHELEARLRCLNPMGQALIHAAAAADLAA